MTQLDRELGKLYVGAIQSAGMQHSPLRCFGADYPLAGRSEYTSRSTLTTSGVWCGLMEYLM